MRFYLTGLARPKKVAQHLTALFPKQLLSTTQGWAAKLYGYRDWHEMAEITKDGKNPPSKLDEYISAEELAERRIDQNEMIYKLTNLSAEDVGRVAFIRLILTSKTPVKMPLKPKNYSPRAKSKAK